MSSVERDNPEVGRGEPDGQRVGDAMLSTPKAIAADATVAELRALFAGSRARSALLVDGAEFAGVVYRDALGDEVGDERPARELARRDVPTIEPEAPLAEATRRLDADGSTRLVVLDRDGRTLRGLLCLKSDRSGFCRE